MNAATRLLIISLLSLPAWAEPDTHTANRAIVRSCSERTEVGATLQVRRQRQIFCQGQPGTRRDRWLESPVNYRLTRQEDGIHLALNLRLNIDSRVEAARAAELLNQARSCIPRIREIWQRYDLRFDLAIDSNRQRSSSPPDHEAALIEGRAQSDAGHYYTQGQITLDDCLGKKRPIADSVRRTCENFIRDSFCSTILHETGHLLGLDDEYPDPNCPNRPSLPPHQPPWSVMYKRALKWDQSEFFPRHIERILKPLCP